jgi:hypothetical protein
MLSTIGLHIACLVSKLDFEHGILKSSGLDQIQSPNARKVYLSNGFELRFVGVDLEAKTGLKKAMGLRIGNYQWQNDLMLYLNRFNLNNLKAPEPNLVKTGQLMLDPRQKVLDALGKGLTLTEKLPTDGPERWLFKFAKAYWIETGDAVKQKMEPSWDRCIPPRTYFAGLSLPQRSLASAFTFACTEFSDTREVSFILSRRMIERDSTNPIAWWYIGQLDNTSLSARMELDWRKQLRSIQTRMGTWQIGKDFIEKRFRESH